MRQKTVASRENSWIIGGLIAVSALAWLILFLGNRGISIPTVCSAELLWSFPTPDTYSYVFLFVSPMQLFAGWGVMVGAMKLPMLADVLIQIRTRSFRCNLNAALLLSTIGYLIVWGLFGILFLGVALTLRIAAPHEVLPFVCLCFVAALWQCSPWKQRALNRCHRRRSFSAFAPSAHWQTLRIGAEHGIWCVATCWAAMLLALLAPDHHLPVMVMVAILHWCERMDEARAPTWCLRLPSRVPRYFIWKLRKSYAGWT